MTIWAEVVLALGTHELASWPLGCSGSYGCGCCSGHGCGCAPDLADVEQVARWCLAAARCGCSIRLRRANPSFQRLLALCGLACVLEDRSEPDAWCCTPPSAGA